MKALALCKNRDVMVQYEKYRKSEGRAYMKIPENFRKSIDLEASMKKYAESPSQARKRRFFLELWEALFLVPCKDDGRDLGVLNNKKGEVFLPTFTDKNEIGGGFFSTGDFAALSLEQLHHIVIDLPNIEGIVINPFGKALTLKRPQLDEIKAEMRGMTVRRIDHAKPQKIEPMAVYTKGLADAFCEVLSGISSVRKAWIVMACATEEIPSHKLFVIDFDGDRKDVFPKVAERIRSFMAAGESFELIKAGGSLLKEVSKRALPVYLKKEL